MVIENFPGSKPKNKLRQCFGFCTLNKIGIAFIGTIIIFCVFASLSINDIYKQNKTDNSFAFKVFKDFYSLDLSESVNLNDLKLKKIPLFYKSKYIQKHILNGSEILVGTDDNVFDNSSIKDFNYITALVLDGSLVEGLEAGFNFVKLFNHKKELTEIDQKLVAYQILRNISIACLIDDDDLIKQSINEFFNFVDVKKEEIGQDGLKINNVILEKYCQSFKHGNVSFKDLILHLSNKY